MRSIWILAAAAACGGSSEPVAAPVVPAASASASAPAAPPAPSASAPAAPADEKACATDADCVIVELACCDHCNGGRIDAFHQAAADKHRPTCGPTACTRRACARAVPVCQEKRCVAARGVD